MSDGLNYSPEVFGLFSPRELHPKQEQQTWQYLEDLSQKAERELPENSHLQTAEAQITGIDVTLDSIQRSVIDTLAKSDEAITQSLESLKSAGISCGDILKQLDNGLWDPKAWDGIVRFPTSDEGFKLLTRYKREQEGFRADDIRDSLRMWLTHKNQNKEKSIRNWCQANIDASQNPKVLWQIFVDRGDIPEEILDEAETLTDLMKVYKIAETVDALTELSSEEKKLIKAKALLPFVGQGVNLILIQKIVDAEFSFDDNFFEEIVNGVAGIEEYLKEEDAAGQLKKKKLTAGQKRIIGALVLSLAAGSGYALLRPRQVPEPRNSVADVRRFDAETEQQTPQATATNTPALTPTPTQTPEPPPTPRQIVIKGTPRPMPQPSPKTAEKPLGPEQPKPLTYDIPGMIKRPAEKKPPQVIKPSGITEDSLVEETLAHVQAQIAANPDQEPPYPDPADNTDFTPPTDGQDSFMLGGQELTEGRQIGGSKQDIIDKEAASQPETPSPDGTASVEIMSGQEFTALSQVEVWDIQTREGLSPPGYFTVNTASVFDAKTHTWKLNNDNRPLRYEVYPDTPDKVDLMLNKDLTVAKRGELRLSIPVPDGYYIDMWQTWANQSKTSLVDGQPKTDTVFHNSSVYKNWDGTYYVGVGRMGTIFQAGDKVSLHVGFRKLDPKNIPSDLKKHLIPDKPSILDRQTKNVNVSELPFDVQTVLKTLNQNPKLSPIQKAAVFSEWIRNNFTYSLDTSHNLYYDSAPNPQEYIRRIFDQKKGRYVTCIMGNTALVEVLRSMGIPARLVTGYKNNNDALTPQNSKLTAAGRHAWAEVWNEASGQWVPFDATPTKLDKTAAEALKQLVKDGIVPVENVLDTFTKEDWQDLAVPPDDTGQSSGDNQVGQDSSSQEITGEDLGSEAASQPDSTKEKIGVEIMSAEDFEKNSQVEVWSISVRKGVPKPGYYAFGTASIFDAKTRSWRPNTDPHPEQINFYSKSQELPEIILWKKYKINESGPVGFNIPVPEGYYIDVPYTSAHQIVETTENGKTKEDYTSKNKNVFYNRDGSFTMVVGKPGEVFQAGDTLYININLRQIDSADTLPEMKQLAETDKPNAYDMATKNVNLNILPDEVKTVLASMDQQDLGPSQKAEILTNWIKNNFTYSFNPLVNDYYKVASSPQEYFQRVYDKGQGRKGTCIIANTALVETLKAKGITARLVNGYRVNNDPLSPDNNKLGGVRHSWTEVWDKATGKWVSFDATPVNFDTEAIEAMKKMVTDGVLPPDNMLDVFTESDWRDLEPTPAPTPEPRPAPPPSETLPGSEQIDWGTLGGIAGGVAALLAYMGAAVGIAKFRQSLRVRDNTARENLRQILSRLPRLQDSLGVNQAGRVADKLTKRSKFPWVVNDMSFLGFITSPLNVPEVVKSLLYSGRLKKREAKLEQIQPPQKTDQIAEILAETIGVGEGRVEQVIIDQNREPYRKKLRSTLRNEILGGINAFISEHPQAGFLSGGEIANRVNIDKIAGRCATVDEFYEQLTAAIYYSIRREYLKAARKADVTAFRYRRKQKKGPEADIREAYVPKDDPKIRREFAEKLAADLIIPTLAYYQTLFEG